MTLTPEQIGRISRPYGESSIQGFDHILAFAQAIEAEVRKSDEALIRQLVDALSECKDSTQERIDTLTESGIDKHKPRYFRSYVQDLQRAADAISAANARLEGKPCFNPHPSSLTGEPHRKQLLVFPAKFHPSARTPRGKFS